MIVYVIRRNYYISIRPGEKGLEIRRAAGLNQENPGKP